MSEEDKKKAGEKEIADEKKKAEEAKKEQRYLKRVPRQLITNLV